MENGRKPLPSKFLGARINNITKQPKKTKESIDTLSAMYTCRQFVNPLLRCSPCAHALLRVGGLSGLFTALV